MDEKHWKQGRKSLAITQIEDLALGAGGNLHENQPSEALHIIELSLENTDLSESDRWGLGYLHALALESLGRDDEALAEYIAIYKVAPESAWGMLAALHLEVVETE